MFDTILIADAIEDMGAKIAPGRTVAVLRQIGERHAVVGQNGMDRVWECLDHAAEEVVAVPIAASVNLPRLDA